MHAWANCAHNLAKFHASQNSMHLLAALAGMQHLCMVSLACKPVILQCT